MRNARKAHRRLARMVLTLALCPAMAVAAAPVDPGAPLPPGHPPVGGGMTTGAAPAPVDPGAPLPPGHPPVGGGTTTTGATPAAPGSALPAGHPPIDADAKGSMAAGPDTPEGTMPGGHPPMAGHPGAGASSSGLPRPVQDSLGPAQDLGPGMVEVVVQDGASAPLPGRTVTLGILKQEVAEGDSREHRAATTDAQGVARFRDLPTGSAYSFRATVESSGASYSAGPFRLDETTGQRALLHVHPVSHDLASVMVGTRGTVFVQPREDVFAVEATFNVINVGGTTWVPEGVKLELPPGAKAFRANDSMSDARIEQAKNGDVLLLGTFSPGQHEVGFQFQLENTHEADRRIEVPMPPRIFELRVFAERATGMTMEVPGFPEAEALDGENGAPLLGTGRQPARGEPPIDRLEIRLGGMPIPSPGRWYAVLLASAIALGGLIQLTRRRSASEARAGDARQAEALLLDELVEIERLHSLQKIGPRTYQEARTELLDSLARIWAGARTETR